VSFAEMSYWIDNVSASLLPTSAPPRKQICYRLIIRPMH
jgi:hypothetical protein